MPQKRYPDAFLRRLRNEIPIDWLIRHLGWPSKRREGQFVFVCPHCGETLSDIKRETNLGRCFHCEINFNPIDFTMKVREYDFVQAVEYLTPFLPRRN